MPSWFHAERRLLANQIAWKTITLFEEIQQLPVLDENIMFVY